MKFYRIAQSSADADGAEHAPVAAMMRHGILERTPVIEECDLHDFQNRQDALDVELFFFILRRQDGTDGAVRRLNLELEVALDVDVD